MEPLLSFDHFPCHLLHSNLNLDPFPFPPPPLLHLTHSLIIGPPPSPLSMDRAPPQAAEEPHNHTSSSSSAATPPSSSGHMGKHRMSAAISFLNQQIQTIQVFYSPLFLLFFFWYCFSAIFPRFSIVEDE